MNPEVPSEKRGLSRRHVVSGAVVSGAALAGGSLVAGPATAAPGSRSGLRDRGHTGETTFVNGRFLTMDRHDSVADWVVVRDGRITDLGRGRAPSGGRKTDLRGATAIPGLVDSHVHFIRDGVNPGHEVRSIEVATTVSELLDLVSQRARSVPAGEFITCIGGWNRNGVAEQRVATTAELDRAAPRNPVYLSETGGGRAGITNTAAAAFFTGAGVAVNADGSVASTSAAQAALTAVQTDADRQRGTAEAIDFASSLGLTMVHDQGGLVGLSSYAYTQHLWWEHALKLRIRFNHFSGTDTGISMMQTRIDNNINRLGDLYYRPIGVGERVNTVTTSPLFLDACTYVAQHGWTITQHSLSPDEVEFHIGTYEQVAATGAPIDDLRWSLCHVNPITPDQIQRVKDLGIALNIQGYAYLNNPAQPPVAGPPFRNLVAAGIPIGGGSDATNVTALNPWLQMSYMTTGKNNAGLQTNDPAQSISRLEALRLYTIGSAYLSFDERDLGSLEVGKLADIAVLSDDPLRASDDRFKRIRSTMTVVGGEVVSRGQAFAHA
jgi:predicted amidohydrolase YtcJ